MKCPMIPGRKKVDVDWKMENDRLVTELSFRSDMACKCFKVGLSQMNSKPQGPILLAPRLACNPIVLGAELSSSPGHAHPKIGRKIGRKIGGQRPPGQP